MSERAETVTVTAIICTLIFLIIFSFFGWMSYYQFVNRDNWHKEKMYRIERLADIKIETGEECSFGYESKSLNC